MAQINVSMAHEDIELVERLFYEYNAAKDLVGYLMQQDKVNETYLQQYINITERRFAELEMHKDMMDRRYRPANINPTNYTFDFINEQLIYDVE